ncbi:arsenate reductase/protein-tyrosine-phosphatase family protein [Agreia sp. Leaf210]|uniref:arsenate reductase/protein-tyrosine-phosphatase family protein n=1 Tax=Agreia sp. Leaf210 TaxID=1735682 RepID=UPI0009EB7147
MVQSDAEGDFFDVLFVCTGNICRSPLAEQLFRSQTRSMSDLVSTRSAGTHALTGRPMTSEAAFLSQALGGDPSDHMARDLTTEGVQRADLILVAAREHRAAVVSLVPRASRKTFTLREFQRLLETHAERTPRAQACPRKRNREGLGGFIADVSSMRGLSRVVRRPGDDDIVDPYRRSFETYEEAGQLILSAVTEVSRNLQAATGLAPVPIHNETLRNSNLATRPTRFRSNHAGEQ